MKKQLWGFFCLKDLMGIFLDLLIPLRCPQLQGAYSLHLAMVLSLTA